MNTQFIFEIMENVIAAAQLAGKTGAYIEDVVAFLLLEILCLESGHSVRVGIGHSNSDSDQVDDLRR